MTPRPLPSTTVQRGGLSWGLALLCGVLIGTLLYAPASWLAQAVASATQGRVQLLNPSGTVWHGRADLLLTGGPGSQARRAVEGGLSWDWGPAWQSSPGLSWRLWLGCCTETPITGHLSAHRHGLTLQVQPFQGQAPLDLLAGLGTPWDTVQLHGRLRVTSPGLTLTGLPHQPQLQGQASADLLRVQSALSPLKPVGDYQLKLTASAQAPAQLNLSTLSGALALSGQGEWLAGRWRFRGLAEITPDHVQSLSNLLNLLGRRDGLRAHISLG